MWNWCYCIMLTVGGHIWHLNQPHMRALHSIQKAGELIDYIYIYISIVKSNDLHRLALAIESCSCHVFPQVYTQNSKCCRIHILLFDGAMVSIHTACSTMVVKMKQRKASQETRHTCPTRVKYGVFIVATLQWRKITVQSLATRPFV